MRAVIAALILVVSIAIGLPASAASWAWCSSDKEGTWQPGFGRWFVQNDAWSGSAGPQRICAAAAWTMAPQPHTLRRGCWQEAQSVLELQSH